MSQSRLNSESSARRLLGRIAPADFRNRSTELAAIARHGRRETPDRALLLVCEPGTGASELLRQAFDEAFHTHDEVIPIYFRFGEFDRSAAATAQRFLRTFLQQITAYRQNDPGLLASSPAIADLVEVAQPGDAAWFEGLIYAFDRARFADDDASLVQVSLSAPLRAAQRGLLPLVMIDDLHHADLLPEGAAFVSALYAAFSRANVPFVLAGRRRRIVKLVESAREEIITGPSLKLDRLNTDAAAELTEHLAKNAGVSVSAETRDLMAQQLAGSPKFLTAVVQAARESGRSLNSFREFQQLYTDEQMGGRLGRINSSRLDEVLVAAPRTSSAGLIELLYEGLEAGTKASGDIWLRRLDLSPEDLPRVTQILAGTEFLELDGAAIEVSGNSDVRADYLRLRHRIELQQLPRALVMADAVVEYVKRAPVTMAREYRRAAALALRETLARFDGQMIPTLLLDDAMFRRDLKGRGPARVAELIGASGERQKLPQIIQATHGGAIFPALRAVCDDERCAVGRGFEGTDYNDASETAWLAVELETKTAVGRALTEVWCDRLDNVARACGFPRWVLWLVAPEGFSDEALEHLERRGAFGSNFEQYRLLTERLAGPPLPAIPADETELVIPMAEDAELAAAEAVEEIARHNNFPPEAINQIKTAIIEACINAAEHSLSPDRKIRLHVRMEEQKLVIRVSSRGIHRTPQVAGSVQPGTVDRGMGLGLIRALMDEVEFERVDDGTSLRMVKHRQAPSIH
jgi:serine/threonine-protein kinase RsbW